MSDLELAKHLESMATRLRLGALAKVKTDDLKPDHYSDQLFFLAMEIKKQEDWTTEGEQ